MPGGGTWVTQNKVRPGAYVNFRTALRALGVMGERGTAALPIELPWGPENKIVTINAGDNLMDLIGIDILDPAALLIKEMLKRARTVLLYRLNEGVKATVTQAPLTVTAKYSGTYGNKITVAVQQNIDNESTFDVITYYNGREVDKQEQVATVADLEPNSYVTFSGTGALTLAAGLVLAGGADGAVTNQDYSDFLAALELETWQTVALPSTDDSLKALFASYIKRLRELEGRHVQASLANYSTADYPGIISIKNGIKLADGTVIDAAKATAWVAGATAGAEVNESLTLTAYDDAVEVDIKYTNSQIEAALKAGEFVFVNNYGKAVVEQDINSFTSFTPTMGKKFAKNRPLRVFAAINNDVKDIYNRYYAGKVDNNEDGRNMLRSELTTYCNTLQGINAIQNFDPETDIVIEPGVDGDAIVVGLYIQDVDSMEKAYINVEVR